MRALLVILVKISATQAMDSCVGQVAVMVCAVPVARRMAFLLSRCRFAGPSVPAWLDEKFDGLDNDAETRKLVAATVAAGQVQKLAKAGVEDFHFYTMNRADLVFAISHLLGFRPNGAQKAA